MNSVTRHQAAVMLGVTDQTISNYCKEGLLGHYRGKGNILYINLDELEKYKSDLKEIHANEQLIEEKKRSLHELRSKLDAADMELRGTIIAHKPKDDSLIKVIENLYCAGFIPNMSRRECTIMQMYIYGETQKNIGEKFNLSYPRVQQLIAKAISRFDDFALISANLDTHESLNDIIKNLRLENDMLRKEIRELKNKEDFNPSEYLTTLLNSKIEDYHVLSRRAMGVLERFKSKGWNGDAVPMITIGDLVMRSGGKLNILQQRFCGKKTFYEIDDLVEMLNLDFKDRDESELDYFKRMQQRFGKNNNQTENIL